MPRRNEVLLEALREAANAANIPRLMFHDQPHTHAVGALRAGYRVMVVAHRLGHGCAQQVWTRYGRSL
jgi:integrase